MRRAFEQLADNLDVLAGAMRTGHSTMGALSVMVDSAIEPSKTEFRRVLQDEQLGFPSTTPSWSWRAGWRATTPSSCARHEAAARGRR